MTLLCAKWEPWLLLINARLENLNLKARRDLVLVLGFSIMHKVTMRQQGGNELSLQTWSNGDKQSNFDKLNGDMKP
jgi:hypothetical protein